MEMFEEPEGQDEPEEEPWPTPSEVELADTMAVFSFPGWFLVARPSQQQKSDGSVTFDLLGQADQKTFTAAREAEVSALIELGALRIMSLSESNEFRRQSAEHVLPSMFVDRWKPTDDKSVKAKSRLVILGWKDPEVLTLKRSSPTPLVESFHLLLRSRAT